MSTQKGQIAVSVKDKDLFEQLKSFSEATGLSIEDITEEALREYLAKNRGKGQSPDDDVFNPDPGA